MGEDTGTKRNVFFEIALGKSVAAELELGGFDVSEVSIQDAKGVELGDMVAANLVGTNKKLHLNTNEHRGWLAGDDKPSSDHPALRPVQRATLARRRRDAEDVWTAELGTTASYSTPCPYQKNRHSMTGARTGGSCFQSRYISSA